MDNEDAGMRGRGVLSYRVHYSGKDDAQNGGFIQRWDRLQFLPINFFHFITVAFVRVDS